MTEGEVCLDYARMAETQRQTQLGHASAVKRVFFSENAIYGYKMKAARLSSEPSLKVIWGMSA